MIFTIEEILSCGVPRKRKPAHDTFDRMEQFEAFAELPPELMPSDERKPPLMVYGYPMNLEITSRYAAEHGLTVINSKTNKVHNVQTSSNIHNKIWEDYNVGMHCEGVWGCDGALWVLRTNYEMQPPADWICTCSDEKARVIWKELVGRDEAPKWYLSGGYMLPS